MLKKISVFSFAFGFLAFSAFADEVKKEEISPKKKVGKVVSVKVILKDNSIGSAVTTFKVGQTYEFEVVNHGTVGHELMFMQTKMMEKTIEIKNGSMFLKEGSFEKKGDDFFVKDEGKLLPVRNGSMGGPEQKENQKQESHGNMKGMEGKDGHEEKGGDSLSKKYPNDQKEDSGKWASLDPQNAEEMDALARAHSIVIDPGKTYHFLFTPTQEDKKNGLTFMCMLIGHYGAGMHLEVKVI